ncbi:MAG: DUF4405 domain-containing protein [Candidatus Paceibacterota bacterium]|jgi:hypothetical protein|nr:DUF4405 domain-containing protein [Candidatus Paceibacterota bacterium]MDD4875213.1 DUF4405 domain-containing protein [Candidatus Paceibacterota bacterium]
MRKINAIVDISSFFAALASFLSGIVTWKILPFGQGFKGGAGDPGSDFFLSLARHSWMDVHIISSLIFVALVVIHLALHWHWIKNLPKMFK